jgi:hypothetical protein
MDGKGGDDEIQRTGVEAGGSALLAETGGVAP